MRPAILVGIRREDGNDRVRQDAVAEAIYGAFADHLLGRRRAKRLGKRNAGDRINGKCLADRRIRRLRGDRQRQGPALADAGDDWQVIGVVAGRALHLLAERFDVRHHDL